jgi:hypothetical protein
LLIYSDESTSRRKWLPLRWVSNKVTEERVLRFNFFKCAVEIFPSVAARNWTLLNSSIVGVFPWSFVMLPWKSWSSTCSRHPDVVVLGALDPRLERLTSQRSSDFFCLDLVTNQIWTLCHGLASVWTDVALSLHVVCSFCHEYSW